MTPGYACDSQVLEKAQNGNGRLLQEVDMDSGPAPHPLGVGAPGQCAVNSSPRRSGLNRMTTIIATATMPATSASAKA